MAKEAKPCIRSQCAGFLRCAFVVRRKEKGKHPKKDNIGFFCLSCNTFFPSDSQEEYKYYYLCRMKKYLMESILTKMKKIEEGLAEKTLKRLRGR